MNIKYEITFIDKIKTDNKEIKISLYDRSEVIEFIKVIKKLNFDNYNIFVHDPNCNFDSELDRQLREI